MGKDEVHKKRYRSDLWGHNSGYWETGSHALEKEAFAHMFEASFDPNKIAMMKIYLPTAWSGFEKILRGL